MVRVCLDPSELVIKRCKIWVGTPIPQCIIAPVFSGDDYFISRSISRNVDNRLLR
jgi:hypothetical protein